MFDFSDAFQLLWEEIAFFVYPAEEAEIWLDGYPLMKTIVLTLNLSKLGFLQSFTQMLLMAKLTDFVLNSVHWLIFTLLNYLCQNVFYAFWLEEAIGVEERQGFFCTITDGQQAASFLYVIIVVCI